MKKIFILSCIFLIFTNCTPTSKKPFVIISKRPNTNYTKDDMGNLTIQYNYIDSLGTERYFYDSDKYSVGDTL